MPAVRPSLHAPCRLLLGLALLVGAAPAWAEDAEPPAILHQQVESAPAGRPLTIRARITDESGVFDPAVLYRPRGEGEFLRIPMQASDDDEGFYEATLPSEIVGGDLEYFIEAFDALGNGPARFGDAAVPMTVRVLPTASLRGSGSEGAARGPSSDGGAEAPKDAGGALWVGLGVGAGALALVAAGVVGGVALYLLSREDTPAQVDVVIRAPAPVMQGVGP